MNDTSPNYLFLKTWKLLYFLLNLFSPKKLGFLDITELNISAILNYGCFRDRIDKREIRDKVNLLHFEVK